MLECQVSFLAVISGTVAAMVNAIRRMYAGCTATGNKQCLATHLEKG